MIDITGDTVLHAQWKAHIHKTRLIPAAEPTCTQDGNIEYYYCDGCGKMFSEAEALVEAPTIDFFFIPATGHTMKHVPEKAATCTKNGNTAYYICDVCGEWFADEAGAEPISDHSTTVIQAPGHDWNAPTYTWSDDLSTVTAKRVCKSDPTHVQKETVNTVKTEIPATYETPGSVTYTADFENEAFKQQTRVVETEPLVATTTAITTTTTSTTKKTTTTTTTTSTSTTTTTTMTETTTTQPVLSKEDDLNGDGKVSSADAVLLARYMAEDHELPAEQLNSIRNAKADQDGDGCITILDLKQLFKKILSSDEG